MYVRAGRCSRSERRPCTGQTWDAIFFLSLLDEMQLAYSSQGPRSNRDGKSRLRGSIAGRRECPARPDSWGWENVTMDSRAFNQNLMG